MKKVVILGSTGSIGLQALEILEGDDSFQVVGLAANSNDSELVAQAGELGLKTIALSDRDAAARAQETFVGRVLSGSQCCVELLEETAPDLVLNALVGASGLRPTVAALATGVDVALANKESLVIGGELVTELSRGTGAELIPVDSEHSALDQLIGAAQPGTVDRLVLTASGGPFLNRDDLAGVSVAEALDHPTWSMGGRITIDSATLMNKGFEVIEAHHLFGVPYDRIEVVVHPQSIVHSLIDLTDGATLAHLGEPDMRVPISFALNGSQRPATGCQRLDLTRIGRLDFLPADDTRFRCLKLAREAGIAGGLSPCVLNAADEIAVTAFLDERLAFTGIAEVVEEVLDIGPQGPVTHFDDLFEADVEARHLADEVIDRMSIAEGGTR